MHRWNILYAEKCKSQLHLIQLKQIDNLNEFQEEILDANKFSQCKIFHSALKCIQIEKYDWIESFSFGRFFRLFTSFFVHFATFHFFFFFLLFHLVIFHFFQLSSFHFHVFSFSIFIFPFLSLLHYIRNADVHFMI